MPAPRFAPILRPWLFVALLLPFRSWAACGLNMCPRPSEGKSSTAELGLGIKQAGFDLEGTAGSYTEFMVEGQVAWKGRLVSGFMRPWILLELPHEDKGGPGNLVALAEWRSQPPLGRAALGMQLEIPMGMDEDGLASPHYLLIPYAGWSQAWVPL